MEATPDRVEKAEPTRDATAKTRTPDATSSQHALQVDAGSPFRRCWRQFRSDVFGERASVRPLAGWFLLALLALVVFLTLKYAPHAFERPQVKRLPISVETGYWTIVIVALVALLTGFEPHIARGLDDWAGPRGRRLLGRQPAIIRTVFPVLLLLARLVWRTPATLWNFLDYLLARPLAFLAGATQRTVARRYAWGAIVIGVSMAVGLLVRPPAGLYAVIVGMLAILGVLRRWSWTEADRDTFLVERGERTEASRVGFTEDLRDEALCALACLLILIPLALRQVQQATCPEHCAFAPDTTTFLDWLGFFGAELAKAVPFVDWSEVFRVANESPIEPKTTLGAQVVFAVRAMLDLLLLAALVQAVQIAGRLRDQNAAFRARQLPVLEPFAEARELHRAGSSIEDALGLRPSEQPAIAAFPPYDAERLRELLRDPNPTMHHLASRAAAALLARQHPSVETDRLLTDRAVTEPHPAMRAWIVAVASGLAPERDPRCQQADRERLKLLLADPWEQNPVRAAAARRLGRMKRDDASNSLLLERLSDEREHLTVRADAAVALAKLQVAGASAFIFKLAQAFKGPLEGNTLLAAMATAHACARAAPQTPHQIAEAFHDALRQHATRAASIQTEPMNVSAASAREPGIQYDQMVRISVGEGSFSPTFYMGSSDTDDQAFPDEKPGCEITMKQAFALGRFPVTHEEYLGFCAATGRPPLERSTKNRWPATRVSWHDAMAYCDWLNRITGEHYCLPTEAEWEYACRAGTTTRYWWGDEWHDDKARSNRAGLNEPSDVGSYNPNPWGLWDMHGNVHEWCADPWHQSHYGRPADGSVWLTDGDFSRRIVRGGSWFDLPRALRAANRNWFASVGRDHDVGFRLARTLSLTQ